ncbi:MAG: hypothetical protein HWN68_12615 [Desulfobacterales bacterium]|nr:hypothetical protein [Desulfobacterales bacterium]
MKPMAKPVHRSGNKNIYCPFYSNCLDHAAKRYWQYWDCSECRHKLRAQQIRLDRNTSGFDPRCELPMHGFTTARARFSST